MPQHSFNICPHATVSELIPSPHFLPAKNATEAWKLFWVVNACAHSTHSLCVSSWCGAVQTATGKDQQVAERAKLDSKVNDSNATAHLTSSNTCGTAHLTCRQGQSALATLSRTTHARQRGMLPLAVTPANRSVGPERCVQTAWQTAKTQWLEGVVIGAVVLYGGPQLCHTTQLNSRPTMPNTNWPQFLQVYIQVWVPVGAAWCTCARKESSPCKLQLCIGCIQIGPCRHGHAMHVSQASTQHDAVVHRHTSHQATLATDQHQNKGAQVQPASGYQQGHPSHHTSRPHAVLNPFT
jgi:hypothetical protein